MDSCIFCKIVKGDISAKTIYEDDHVLAFLDIQPLSEGHLLVIPKMHAERLHDISDGVLQDILVVLKKLALSLGVKDYNILQNNGSIAHQAVFHAHFHLIPKTSTTGLSISWEPMNITDEKLTEIENKIKSKL